jgi:hypothetical protein
MQMNLSHQGGENVAAVCSRARRETRNSSGARKCQFRPTEIKSDIGLAPVEIFVIRNCRLSHAASLRAKVVETRGELSGRLTRS